MKLSFHKDIVKYYSVVIETSKNCYSKFNINKFKKYKKNGLFIFVLHSFKLNKFNI